MRYTTIIDISTIPQVYGNITTRCLYFHMCLKCGYTDEDRDLYTTSLRNTANELGVTLSALRNSLSILAKVGLIEPCKNGYKVKKYLTKVSITPRAKTEAEEKKREAKAVEIEEQEKRRQEYDDNVKRIRAAEAAAGMDSLDIWLYSLVCGAPTDSGLRQLANDQWNDPSRRNRMKRLLDRYKLENPNQTFYK